MIENNKIRHLLTRAAVAFVFIVFGAWEIIQPSFWTYYVPTQLSGVVSSTLLVTIHGCVLLILGIAILAGAYIKIAAIIGSVIMFLISAGLLIDAGFSDMLVRDVTILLLVISLVFDETRYLTLTK